MAAFLCILYSIINIIIESVDSINRGERGFPFLCSFLKCFFFLIIHHNSLLLHGVYICSSQL